MTKNSRKLTHFVMSPLCALFFFMGTVAVHAETYYAATTGNDAQSCATARAITTPMRTIASGVACLNPGDTLYLRAGTYTEQIDLQLENKTGTAGNYITIAGYPGETVTVRYADPAPDLYGVIKARGVRGWLIFDNLILDGVLSSERSGWQIRDGNHDFILRNLEIKHFHYNGVYVSAANITIQNSKIHDQVTSGVERWYGIYFHDGNNGLIETTQVYNNPGGGIHAYPGSISNLIIRGNSVHHNNSMTTSAVGGLIVYQGSGTPVSGVQIYNNLVYSNSTASAGGTSEGIRVSNGSDATKVWNNTVYGNKGWGINIQTGTGGAPTNTFVQNNIVYGNTSGAITNGGTGSIIDHNLTTNPNFVNAAAFDFNIQTTSPAIDAGIILSQVPTDFKNNPRPQGATHDIGAFEVGTGSDSVPPVAPLGLRVN